LNCFSEPVNVNILRIDILLSILDKRATKAAYRTHATKLLPDMQSGVKWIILMIELYPYDDKYTTNSIRQRRVLEKYI